MTTRLVQLRDLLEDIQSGVSPVCEERFPEPGECGVLTLAAITTGRFTPEHAKAIRADAVSQAWTTPKRGSILITRASGSKRLVGSCVLVDADYPNRIVPDTAWQLVAKATEVVPIEWLFEYLRSRGGRKQVLRAARGSSGIWKITKGTLGRFLIPVPPGQTVKAAAALALATDGTLRVLGGLIRAKSKFKRAMMQDLLTGRRRFPECGSEQWVEASLDRLFEERNETGFRDLRLLSVTADRGIIPREQVERKDTSNKDKSAYKRVCVGDIAYNTMRMWQGVSALCREEGIVSPAYTVIVTKGTMLPEYAQHLFKLPRQIHEFLRRSQGLVDDTLALKFPNFAKVRVRFPGNQAEQARIARLLGQLDAELGLLVDMQERVTALSRGLMQKLLSGEIELPPRIGTNGRGQDHDSDDHDNNS